MTDKPAKPMDPNVEPEGYEPPTSAEELLERYGRGERYFVGADLGEASLREANLKGANLAKANLYDADLRGVYMAEANLAEASLCHVSFEEANRTEGL